jgi:hypothetical protein
MKIIAVRKESGSAEGDSTVHTSGYVVIEGV